MTSNLSKLLYIMFTAYLLQLLIHSAFRIFAAWQPASCLLHLFKCLEIICRGVNGRDGELPPSVRCELASADRATPQEEQRCIFAASSIAFFSIQSYRFYGKRRRIYVVALCKCYTIYDNLCLVLRSHHHAQLPCSGTLPCNKLFAFQ